MLKTLRFALFGAGLFVLAGCKSNMDLASDAFTVTPQVLEAVNGKVPVTVDGTFPAKFFKKKAVLTIIPTIQWEGGSVKGDAMTFQGEKIQGNNQVIKTKEGGKFKLSTSFPYQPEMATSELYAYFDCTVKGKKVEIAPVKIADGVIATAELYAATAKNASTAHSTDKFEQIISQVQEANIKFIIQQANVRASETKSDAITALKEAIKAFTADTKNYAVQNIEISAYASPDGGVKLNETLAGQREKNAAKYISNEIKKAKVNIDVESNYTAQDWEGFKKLVEESNIQDKQLILRVLSTYTDPERREAEIKNLSAAYKELADEILPELRRARIALNYSLIGRSDSEIMETYSSDAKELSLEEILYAAGLTEDIAKKKDIYATAAKNFPGDYRAFNNLGEIAFAAGDYATAESNFKKALNINSSVAEINTNMGLLLLAQNKPAQAETYFAKGGNSKANAEALGSLFIAQGQYDRALSALRGSKTNAEALAFIMTKDYNGAKRAISSVANPDGYTSYLNAIIAARTNDAAAVAQNLKKAVTLDPSLKAKAVKDVEFVKFLDAIRSL